MKEYNYRALAVKTVSMYHSVDGQSKTEQIFPLCKQKKLPSNTCETAKMYV